MGNMTIQQPSNGLILEINPNPEDYWSQFSTIPNHLACSFHLLGVSEGLLADGAGQLLLLELNIPGSRRATV